MIDVISLILAIISLGLTVFAWFEKRLSDKDRDGLKSHLRAIRAELMALKANVAETHAAEDVVKTEAGKRWLRALSHQIGAIRLHAEEALGMKTQDSGASVSLE